MYQPLITSSRSRLGLVGQGREKVGSRVRVAGISHALTRQLHIFPAPEPFPYVLELGVRQGGKPPLPFCAGDTSGDKISITKSYDDMFYRLLQIRQHDEGENRGAVLTGQPSIGAPHDQVLTPCDNSPVRLFSRENYLPKVHARAADFSWSGCTPV